MKKYKLILSMLVAQIFWYFLLCFINESVLFFDWSIKSIIVYFILTVANSIYYISEKNKQTN